MIHDILRSFRLSLVHPHIQRCIFFPVGKAPVCRIQLIGGHAQIQIDSIHLFYPQLGKNLCNSFIITPDDGYLIRVLPQVKDVKIYRNEERSDGKLMNFDSSVLPDGEGKAAKVMVLEAKCEPEQALQKVVWKSSDLSVASIDSEGTILFKGTGKTVITATAAFSGLRT